MRILFAHQSYPSQFKYLAPSMAKLGHEVVFMSTPTQHTLPNVRQVSYQLAPHAGNSDDPFLTHMVDSLRYGRAARDTAVELRANGFEPDVIVTHPGWGEALFLKDVFRQARMICFLEFFFARKAVSTISINPRPIWTPAPCFTCGMLPCF